MKLGLPLLDDAGFRVLLEQGADAAREVATTGQPEVAAAAGGAGSASTGQPDVATSDG